MFLHPFVRDIKHNPHIHVLISERVIDNDLKLKKYDYFIFESLRKSFMNQLLKRIYYYLKDNASKSEPLEFSKLRIYSTVSKKTGTILLRKQASSFNSLKLTFFWCSWERKYISNIINTCYIH
jgi:hypothetical protein